MQLREILAAGHAVLVSASAATTPYYDKPEQLIAQRGDELSVWVADADGGYVKQSADRVEGLERLSLLDIRALACRRIIVRPPQSAEGGPACPT